MIYLFKLIYFNSLFIKNIMEIDFQQESQELQESQEPQVPREQKEPQDKCIVCGTLYDLQICEECEEFVCKNKECLDNECINISTWICCLHCYQEKLNSEMETQINEGYLDQCIYCGNTFYYEQKCDCYSYVQEEIDNKFIYDNRVNDNRINDNEMIIEDLEINKEIEKITNNINNILL